MALPSLQDHHWILSLGPGPSIPTSTSRTVAHEHLLVGTSGVLGAPRSNVTPLPEASCSSSAAAAVSSWTESSHSSLVLSEAIALPLIRWCMTLSLERSL